MSKLILLRHGQSEWNKQNLFTGWVDIPLSPEGIAEAYQAGTKIAHIPIDVIFVSTLVRAMETALLAMSVHESKKIPCVQHQHEGRMEDWAKVYSKEAQDTLIPVYTAWQLNERMYGKLQGMNKQETREKFGDEQVKRWRRSFAEAPPEGESLKMTAQRTIPYFVEEIVPYLEAGKNIFVSAHGNSLRSIVMYLDKLSEDQVVALELATGAPLVYTFSHHLWKRDHV